MNLRYSATFFGLIFFLKSYKSSKCVNCETRGHGTCFFVPIDNVRDGNFDKSISLCQGPRCFVTWYVNDSQIHVRRGCTNITNFCNQSLAQSQIAQTCDQCEKDFCNRGLKRLKSTKDKNAISYLMVDLAQVLGENVKLMNANALLKVDVQQCNDRIKEMEYALDEERKKFGKSLQCIHEQLSRTEHLLEDKERKLTEENQEHTSKINNIQAVYIQERDLLRTKENSMQNEIDHLKKQLGKSKDYMEDLLGQLKNAKGKISTYKEKLKFCVNLITDMNTFLNSNPGKNNSEAKQSEKGSQTETKHVKACYKQCHCRGCSLECENIVLSDLFFKDGALQATLDDVLFSLNDNA